MAIEKRLIEKIRQARRKAPYGRSRNDQVALDARLYLKDEIASILSLIKEFQRTILKDSQKHVDTIMTGLHAPSEGSARSLRSSSSCLL